MVLIMNKSLHFMDSSGEYLAGTLSAEMLENFETLLARDPMAKKAVDQLERRMDIFLGTNASDALRAARKDRYSSFNSESNAGPQHEQQSNWSEISPGITGKVLHYDHMVGSMIYIARMEPGARCPESVEGSPEECLLIAGSFSMGDSFLKAGDQHHAPNSIIHSGGHADTGALMLIRAQDA